MMSIIAKKLITALPTIRGLVNLLSSSWNTAISRIFITLDPVTNSYYELSTPFSPAGDFEAELDYSTTAITGRIITTTPDPQVDGFELYLTATTIVARISVGGVQLFLNSIRPADGKLNNVKLIRVGSLWTLSVNNTNAVSTTVAGVTVDITLIGIRFSLASGFDGVIANVKLTDLATPSNSLSFDLDEATQNYELPNENVFGSELSNGETTIPFGSQITVASGLVVGKSYILNISGLSAGEDSRWNGAGWPSISNGNTVLVAIGSTLDLRDFGEDQTGVTVSVREVTNALTYNNITTTDRELFTDTLDGRIGQELLVNGGFDTDTGWFKGVGWTIAGGVASCDGTQTANSLLNQSTGMVDGYFYKVTYTISNYVSGSIIALRGGVTLEGDGTPVGSNGTFVDVGIADGNTFHLRVDLNFIGSVSNVSVRRIIQKP